MEIHLLSLKIFSFKTTGLISIWHKASCVKGTQGFKNNDHSVLKKEIMSFSFFLSMFFIYFKALRIFVYWFEPVSQVSDVVHKPLVLTYALVIWLSKVNGYLNVTYIILDIDVFLIQLSNQYSCLIWTTSPTKAKYLKDLEDDSFVDAVNDAFVSVARIYSHLRQYRFHKVVFGNTCTMYILP